MKYVQRPIQLENIRARIINSPRGTLFVSSDFFDIIDSKNVRTGLLRLEDEGIIRRVLRGIYEYPEYNQFLNEYIAPSPDKVAHAIARNYGWTIVPSGDTALNLLGLSTQVPAVWSYVSDGTYKNYEYDNVKLTFKKTTNKEISHVSYKTALIIQALKALGKENVDVKIIKKISSILTDDEKSQMISEAQYATSWVLDILKSICKCGGQNA